jgi:hypothetical protein
VKNQRVFARVNRQAVAAQTDHVDRLVYRAGGFFDACDIFHFRQARQSLRLDFRSGPAGNVVDDDWNADLGCDFFVVLVDAFLGRRL